jgi:hypothetical protein
MNDPIVLLHLRQNWYENGQNWYKNGYKMGTKWVQNWYKVGTKLDKRFQGKKRTCSQLGKVTMHTHQYLRRGKREAEGISGEGGSGMTEEEGARGRLGERDKEGGRSRVLPFS